MTKVSTAATARSGDTERCLDPNADEPPEVAVATLHPGRSDRWMEPTEMMDAARTFMRTAPGNQPETLVFDLSGLEHLDASALQVLLAIRAEQERRGAKLRMTGVCESLRKWFDYAGASDLLARGADETVWPDAAGENPCARL